MPGQESERRPEPSARGREQRWALVLADAPVAQAVRSKGELRSAAAVSASARIANAQENVRAALAGRKARILGSTRVISNAIFVQASAEEAEQLRQMPGIRQLVPMQPVYRAGNRALELVRAQQAWNRLNGSDRAGLGVRIGIIDSGLDHTHPALTDESLPEPEDGRKCVEASGDCNFTSRKIIAARSYVNRLVYAGQPELSRPDDLTPRDRHGHGTAVAALAAGAEHDSPIGRLSGVAPKAYLGNYKVFGSPGVNDVTFEDVVIAAMEDALLDNMDVITLSLRIPAAFGPLASCGGQPCDNWTTAVERLSRLGLAVVAAAGNDGDLSLFLPSRGSVTSPGTAPSAITVGATQNSHRLFQQLQLQGDDTPDSLRKIPGMFGNGPRPAEPLSAPLVDVRVVEDDGRACSPLPAGRLKGAIALIEAQGCTSRTKVNNAFRAGARAVVLMRAEGGESLFMPDGLTYTPVPLMLIRHTDGVRLRELLAANPSREAVLDPAQVEYDDRDNADIVWMLSSKGPAIGTYEIKPEIVAPGADLFVPTQRFDPAGDMYDATGYTAVSGTSFAVPLVAGAIAISRQELPGLRNRPVAEWAPILKSSVVNTADPRIGDYDENGQIVDASLLAMGSGKLDAESAIATPITVSPSAVSFGIVNRKTLPLSQGLVFTNHVGRAVRLTLTVRRWTEDRNARIEVSPASFTLGANAVSPPVTVRLTGNAPAPGTYEGVILVAIEGSDVPFQIPYLYILGDGVPFNIHPVRNQFFLGQAGRKLAGGFLFKVVDRYGAPVANLPVRLRVLYGGGEITEAFPTLADPRTDIDGVGEVTSFFLGPQLGPQAVEIEVPNLPPFQFTGMARLQPMIETGGIVNAASGRRQEGAAAGSVVSIYGRGLAEESLRATGTGFPLSLGGISVSFDDISRNQSYAGRLVAVSDERVDVMLPWELQGVASVETKVSLDAFTSSSLVTLPLAQASPAFWLADDSATGQQFVDSRDSGGSRIDSSNRARKGQMIRLYANGLGAVDNPPPSGEPASADQPSPVRGSVRLRVGQRELEPEFAGLAPGRTGVYEIRVQLPADLVSGTQDVIVLVNGASSPAARLPIEN